MDLLQKIVFGGFWDFLGLLSYFFLTHVLRITFVRVHVPGQQLVKAGIRVVGITVDLGREV